MKEENKDFWGISMVSLFLIYVFVIIGLTFTEVLMSAALWIAVDIGSWVFAFLAGMFIESSSRKKNITKDDARCFLLMFFGVLVLVSINIAINYIHIDAIDAIEYRIKKDMAYLLLILGKICTIMLFFVLGSKLVSTIFKKANFLKIDQETIDSSWEQLRKIEDLNSWLKGSVVYEKAEEFHKLTKIFLKTLQTLPYDIDDDNINRVFDCYIPSVVKMLDMYLTINKQVTHTKDMKKSKQQIENSIDILNKAVKKLLTDFFKDKASHIYLKTSALYMGLTKEGLEHDVKTKKSDK